VASACVGLDIGSSAIKAVVLDQSRRGTRLVHFGIEYLPPRAIVDGAVMDRPAVVEAVARLKAALGLGSRPVATAISGHSVIVKKIQMPLMGREQIAQRIPAEAEQHIPFKRDEVDLDYQATPSRSDPAQLDIILVAAKKEMIADYLQVIRDAKLNPAVLDVAAFSVQNAFESAYGDTEQADRAGAVALVHVGNAVTHVNVVSGGTSVFVRDVAVGGAAFTEEIQRRLEVSLDDAEHFKIAGADPSGDGSFPEDLDAIIEEVAESTAAKIQRSVDFFLATAPDVTLTRMLLSGGSAHLGALCRQFEQRAKAPVEIMDPFRRTVVDAAKLEPGFVATHAAEAAVAFGLALRRPGDGDP
jgi:type IV pilus assembly protein PilM